MTSASTKNDPVRDRLLRALKSWRNEEAARRSLAPYMVFPNSVAEALADALPKSRAALLSVPGIGNARAALYGDDILRLIRESHS